MRHVSPILAILCLYRWGLHTACTDTYVYSIQYMGSIDIGWGAGGQQTPILEEKGKILERKGKNQRKGAKSREYIGRATPLNEAIDHIDQCLVLS